MENGYSWYEEPVEEHTREELEEIVSSGFFRFYSDDEELFSECVSKKWFDFVILFDSELLTEEFIQNNLASIIAVLKDNLPNGLKESRTLFNALTKQKNFNLLFQFADSLLTEDFIEQNLSSIVDNIQNTIPSSLTNSRVLFNEYAKRQDYNILLQFDDSLITEEFIAQHASSIISNLNDYVPYPFNYSALLFAECVKQKNFNLLLNFADSLFTEEFIQTNLDWLMSNINYFIPSKLNKSQVLLNECVKQGRINLLSSFDKSLLTDEFIKQNTPAIIRNSQGVIPYTFNKSQILFNECVKQKNFTLLKSFDKSLFTEEFIQNNLKWIMKNIDFYLPNQFTSSQTLLLEFCKRKKVNLLSQFDKSLLTEEFIQSNLDWITSSIKKTVPKEFQHSQVLFAEYYKNKNFPLLIQFDKSLLTEEFIQNNLEWIMSNTSDFVPYPLNCSKVLFNEYYKQKNFSLLADFNESLLNEEFIQNNLEWIMSNIKKRVPENFKHSQILFNEYYKQNNFPMLIQFAKSLLTEEFISNNLSQIMNSINDELPRDLSTSKLLFAKYYEQKNFKILMEFNQKFFTEEFIRDNLEWLMSNLKDQLPLQLKFSEVLFNEVNKQKNFPLLIQFNYSLFTEEFIQSNLEWIIDNIHNHLPSSLQFSKVLFTELLNRKQDNLLVQMVPSLFTYDVLKNHYAYFASLVKSNEKFNSLLKNNNDFRQIILEEKDYSTFVILPFAENLLLEERNGNELIFDETELKSYSDILGITTKELANKINDLFKINDEILDTLCPFMLSKKMNCLSFKNIEKLSLYSDIQLKLNNLRERDLMLLNRILNYLDNNLDKSFDITTVIYYIINNWSLHFELISTINSNELTNEQLANLIFVLQRKNDFYSVKSVKDLEPENFNKLTDEVFKNIEERVLSGNITIEELQRAIFEKKYGLDLDNAKFINTRYCQDMEIIKTSADISERNRLILQSINYILNVDNIEELSFLYLTSRRLINNYSFVDLEAQIREDYAKRYNESLYKIKEEHLMKQADFAEPELYDQVRKITYRGKQPQFYVLDGDFNLQIHVLGAYRDWERPDNFKEDWTRPKIAYHGICTSYIGNNQIANARQFHPAYGFDSYAAEAFISIQDSDIFSDGLISRFASSIFQPCCFYPPKEMLDKTRHTHNEFVLERRSDKGSTSYKRLPSYVVYIVDDINNEDNFDLDHNSLFSETVQAAVDNDLPIVIVDRLKYAKSEKQKYEALLEKFAKQPNPLDMKDILLIVCDNMIGCEKYPTQPDMAYHTYFNEEVLTTVLDKIIAVIEQQPAQIRQYLIVELYNFSLKEPLITNENKERIQKLYTTLNLNENNLNKYLANIEILRKVREYYDNASEEIKRVISMDVASGLSYNEIYLKILNDEYHQSKNFK